MNAVRELSVAQWAELVRGGASITVKTKLDGISMQPLIRKDKDVVTIAAVNRPLKRGDIVLFRRADGVYVLHRVRRLRADRVTTIGDNCWNEDMPIHSGDVLGIAVQMQRGRCAIGLDNALSRLWGRCWMACHGVRIGFRRARGAMARRAKRILQWKKTG